MLTLRAVGLVDRVTIPQDISSLTIVYGCAATIVTPITAIVDVGVIALIDSVIMAIDSRVLNAGIDNGLVCACGQ